MNHSNKNLLDSFSWTINNGQPTDYKYIEAMSRQGRCYCCAVTHPLLLVILDRDDDIIKYREISMRDYLKYPLPQHVK
jgi:hypothetical protein